MGGNPGYLLTPSGQALTVRENMELITEATSVPVFGCWDFLLPHGAVGGKVVHGHSQGAAAASLALRILAGERADSIPVVLESPNRYVFNAAMLQKFAIPEALLPPDSQIVYRTAASLLSNWETLSRRLFFAYDLFAKNTTPCCSSPRIRGSYSTETIPPAAFTAIRSCRG